MWHKLHVPRYSFTLWLGFLKKLPTNDRTKHYSGRTWNCPLCNLLPETFNHLFFECAFSRHILHHAIDLGNWSSFLDSWDSIVDFLTDFQGSSLSRNIFCLTVSACFYKVWEARNNKLHRNTIPPMISLAKDVIHIIKSRLSTCQSFLKATNSQYYCSWLFTS